MLLYTTHIQAGGERKGEEDIWLPLFPGLELREEILESNVKFVSLVLILLFSP